MNLITRKRINLFASLLFLIISCKEVKEEPTKVENISFESKLIPSFQSATSPIYYSIDDRLDYYNIVGASIVVVKEGIITTQKHYGYGQIGQDSVKISDKTLFQAGSISKSITAMAIMKLAESGILDLDEDINTYLKTWQLEKPSFIEDAPVTIRQFLSHTSGMINNNYRGFPQNETLPSLEEMLKGKPPYKGAILDTVPTAIHRYSNTGYGVLEKMIEDVTNSSFEDAMKQLVLEPFNMRNSTFETLTSEDSANVSHAFNADGGVHKGLWYNPAVKGGGGLWSTAEDLARFCLKIQDIVQGRDDYITSASMLKMLQPVLSNYGLGFYLKNKEDDLIFFHSGKMKGFTNLMAGYANTKNAVVILTNSDQGGYFFSEVLRGISNEYHWDFMQPKTIETVELSDELQLAYEGVYSGEYEEEIYTIELKKSGTYLLLIDKDEEDKAYALKALSDTLLIDVNDGERLAFIKQPSNNYEILWNNLITFKKVDE
ncbi:serine hydrolase domain-containing protein [Spongiivirga sp. MCCC 1A20706]|uniref:serine hydrolase domain-containing protein n=1 Tax=Spongiivirga sp. MCCC 1A20706 TaxID=3160963 RepID=UPI003977A364